MKRSPRTCRSTSPIQGRQARSEFLGNLVTSGAETHFRLSSKTKPGRLVLIRITRCCANSNSEMKFAFRLDTRRYLNKILFGRFVSFIAFAEKIIRFILRPRRCGLILCRPKDSLFFLFRCSWLEKAFVCGNLRIVKREPGGARISAVRYMNAPCLILRAMKFTRGYAWKLNFRTTQPVQVCSPDTCSRARP